MARGKRTKERTERIELRCTPNERQDWETQAVVQGCSLSVFIRHVLNTHRSRHVCDPALLRQIGAIGNNLNQVARWANTRKEGIEARLVLAELQHIRRELMALAEAAP